MRTICTALLLALTATALMAQTPAKRARKQGTTTITSVRMSYDYTRSLIIFDENVKVKDPDFTLTADKVVVTLEGTNDVKQVRCIGNVVLINEERTARCKEATYTKASGKIVMEGDAMLQRLKDQIWGTKITIWLGDERMECEPARMVLQPTSIQGDGKRMLP